MAKPAAAVSVSAVSGPAPDERITVDGAMDAKLGMVLDKTAGPPCAVKVTTHARTGIAPCTL